MRCRVQHRIFYGNGSLSATTTNASSGTLRDLGSRRALASADCRSLRTAGSSNCSTLHDTDEGEEHGPIDTGCHDQENEIGEISQTDATDEQVNQACDQNVNQ